MPDDEPRFMTEEDVERVKRAAFELWGLEGDRLDMVDAFHAWRILRIKEGHQLEASFHDFAVVWKKYVK